MSLDRLDRVKEVLDGALELDPAARDAYLTQACGDDLATRREVESLLGQVTVEAPLLDRPIFQLHDGAPGKALPDSGLLATGERVGPYQIQRQLGAGGMGTVYLAVREDDFHKPVALKVLRGGFASLEMVRRFHSERQILARLDHPGIARILDAGTTDDGRPWFVMELVEGEPINRFCRGQRLGTRRRLELFLDVLAALGLAHRNLVVHRDLKPSNILVTADGVAKLLDFGIAKELEGSGGITELTGERHPMTLRYASPEQVEGRPIATTSDVYSLGVLLYELLTDASPYPADPASDLALAREIVDGEPRRPSAVATAVDRDLDSIVLKALEKDPERRYSSVEQLADDLRRYLEGRPVQAREGTFSYLAVKFVRRHRWRLAAASVLVTFFFVALASLFLWQREQELRGQFTRLMDDLVLHATVDATDADDAEKLANTERLFDELGVAPDLQAEMLESLSIIYEKRGLYHEALPIQERALASWRQLHPRGHYLVARSVNNLANLHYRLGDFEKAEALHREVLAAKESLGEAERGGERINFPKTMSNLATALAARGELEEAERLYREALALRRAEHDPQSLELAKNLRSLANLLYLRGAPRDAEPLLREALAIRVAVLGADHVDVASVWSTLGRVQHLEGRLAEAERSFTECLRIRQERMSPGHLHIVYARRDLAAVRLDHGDLASAERLLDGVLEALAGDPGSWHLAEAKSLLGALRTAQGRWDEAEPLLRESYEALRTQRGEDTVYTRNAWQRLQALERQRAGG